VNKLAKQLDRFLRKKPALGKNVFIAKNATVIGDVTLGAHASVWYGAVILDGAIIGRQSLIGAKALVTQGTKIPPGSLVLGAPAKVVRKLSKAERTGLKWWAEKYVDNGAYCLKNKINVGAPLPS
jgi:carbonic anhydrase/acetyltransferase-like protein (isoleucine patch superfamily)